VDVFRAKERMPVQHSAQMIPFQSKGAFGAAILPFFPQAVDNVHTIAAILAHGFDGKNKPSCNKNTNKCEFLRRNAIS
jgi:hypothetical protein